MKRIIVVAAISAVMVVGCARKQKTAPAAPPPAPTAELTPPPVPAYTPAPEPVVTPAPAVTPAPSVTPAPAKAATAKPATEAKAEPKHAVAKTYQVKKGDTLSEIAAAHHTTVHKIMALNPEIKKADAIYVGQKLKMP